jgi:cell division transport system permease protein
MRVRLIIAEAWRSLTASKSTTTAATLTVLVAMFVLGTTIGLGTWVLSWRDHIKRELVVKVYFKETVTPQQINAVGQKLEADPRVKNIKFVSKKEALAEMKKKYPTLTENLVFNPLPHMYEVTPKNGDYITEISKSLRPLPPGVDEVKDGGKTSRRVLRVGGILSIVFLVAVILLLTASALLIANTIRLSIFARRREIEVMKLVGATNWFVRGPFMIEGLLCGLGGSLIAIFLLIIGKDVILPWLDINSSEDAKALPFELNALVVIAAGLVLGVLGSGLTLRRFLKV